MKALTIILLILLQSLLCGQEITSYYLDIKIDVKQKKISVDGLINIDFQDKDSIKFTLWKYSDIKEISRSGENLKFFFDTLSPSPMYINNGSYLTVIKTSEFEGKQLIKFIYDCDMRNLNGWAKSFTEDWVELNLYSAWFPVYWGDFTSKILVHIDEGYGITGTGIVSKKEDHWEILKPWSSYDNVIIASNKLQSRTLNESSAYIQTEYCRTNFSESDADSAVNECRYILNMFEELWGKTDSTYLKFVIAPFAKGGGYSRKNFIRMGTTQFDLYAAKGFAHEIAHFWWNKAVTTTWEDWLNEAFAEYSMLLYIRERKGLEEFEKLVEEFKSRTQNLPPVWGIDRGSSDAYSVLYEKGSLILCEMEEMVGKSSFINFLRAVSDSRITATNDLLNLVESKLSKEIRVWLENKLKTS